MTDLAVRAAGSGQSGLLFITPSVVREWSIWHHIKGASLTARATAPTRYDHPHTAQRAQLASAVPRCRALPRTKWQLFILNNWNELTENWSKIERHFAQRNLTELHSTDIRIHCIHCSEKICVKFKPSSANKLN